MTDAPAIEHESAEHGGAFLLRQGGTQVGELHYSLGGGRMTITHTEVVARLRGTGLAQKLVAAAADWARKENLRIVPLCSYAGDVLQRSPAYADLMK